MAASTLERSPDVNLARATNVEHAVLFYSAGRLARCDTRVAQSEPGPDSLEPNMATGTS